MSADLDPAEGQREVSELLARADEASATRLDEIARTADARTAKSARAALFRLKGIGVLPAIEHLPVKKLAGDPSSTSGGVRARRAWMSTVGMEGERSFVFDLGGRGGWFSLIGFSASDMAGVRSLRRAEAREGDLEAVASKLRDSQYGFEPVPPEAALAILVRLSEANRISRTVLPVGYREALRSIGDPEAVARTEHPVYDLWPADTNREEDSDVSGLLDHPVAQRWFLASQLADPWADKADEVLQSKLVLSNAQAKARLAGLYDEATDASYPPEAIARERLRLEDTALVVAAGGDESLARQLLSQAARLDPSRPGRELPFLRELVQATIELVLDLRRERALGAGLESGEIGARSG